MPEEVSQSPEDLAQQGFETGFQPESDFIRGLSQRYPAPAPLTPDQQAEADRAKRQKAVEEFNPTLGSFGASTTRGLIGVGESLAGLGEVASKAIPFAGKLVKPYFKDIGDYLAETAAQIPSGTPSFKDIQSSGEAGSYAAGKVGDIVGFLAPTVVLSLLSGGTSLELQAARALGQETAGQMTLGLSRDLAQRMVTGGFIGTEIGGTFRGIRDATGKEAPFTSVVAGTASGLLLNSGALPIVKEFLDGGVAEGVKRDFLRSYMVDALSAASRHGLFLGGASAGSEAIHLLANKFADKTYSLVNSQNLVHVTDAFLSGLIGGGVVGGAGRIIGGPRSPAPGLEDLRGQLTPDEARTEPGAAAVPIQDTLAARDEADRAMAAAGQPGATLQPNPFGAPPDAGIKAAMAEATAHVANAAAVSAVESARVAEASKPVTDSIIAQPDKPVPPVDVGAGLSTAEAGPARTPVDDFVNAQRKAEADRAMERAGERGQAQPNPFGQAPEAGIKPEPPKPQKPLTEKEKAAIKKQLAAENPASADIEEEPPKPTYKPKDKKAMDSKVAKAIKSLDKMGDTELAGAEAVFTEMLRGFAGKVRNADISAAIDQLQAAMAARRKAMRPSAGNLLVDSNGNPAESHFSFDHRTGKVHLVYTETKKVGNSVEKSESIGYTTNGKFKSLDDFLSKQGELTSDPTAWSRHKRSSAWFANDAPFRLMDSAAWTGAFLDRLTAAHPELGGIVRELTQSAGLTHSQVLGILRRASVSEGGKVKQLYSASLSPSKAAELFPDAIKKGIEADLGKSEKPSAIPESATPEERAALEQQSAERESTLKRLQAAHEFEPAALREWLIRSEERNKSYLEKPQAAKKADVDENPEEKADTSGVVESYIEGAVRMSDVIAANLGDEAGDLAYSSLTDGGLDHDSFVAQMGKIVADKTGAKPDAAAKMAEDIYSQIDQKRQGGGYHGRLAEGVDYHTQTSAEDPIVHAQARGATGILRLINDPRFGISDKMRAFTQRFLERVDPIYLDHLTLQAVSKLDINGRSFVTYEGSFEPIMRIAKVLMNSNNPDVIAHEIAHNLYYYLPEEMRQRVDADWRQAVNAAIARERDPAARDLLQRAMEGGGLRGPLRGPFGRLADVGKTIEVTGPDGKTYKTRFDGYWDLSHMGRGMLPQLTALEDIPGVTVKGSSHFVKSLVDKGVKVPDLEEALGSAGAGYPLHQYYHLINPEEYFVRQLLRKTNGTVWDYVRDFITQIGNAFKGWIGLDKENLWDEIAAGFRDGKFEDRYQIWASQDRASTDPGVFGSLAESLKSFEANRNARQTDELRRREAESAGTQNLTARNVMERVAKTIEGMGGVVSAMARRLAGITQSNEILNILDSEGTHPKTFLDIVKNPDISQRDKEYFAADVARFQNRAEQRLERARTKIAWWEQEFKSDRWQRRLERLGEIKTKLEDHRENITSRLVDLIQATISRNQEDLKSRSIAEGKSDAIMREISALEKLKAEKGGIGQLMRHMISVLSLSPEGRQLVMGEGEFTADEVLRAYENVVGDTAYAREISALKLPESDAFYRDSKRIEAITREANHLVNVKRAFYGDAAGFLVRLHDLARDLMTTELLATDGDAYVDYVNNYGPKFLKALEKDPAKFAKEMAAASVNTGTKDGMMMAAFRTLNSKISRSLTHYDALVASRLILEHTLADPQVKAAHQAALNLIGSETPPVRLKGEVRASDVVVDEHGNYTTFLPDGKSFKFNLSVGRERLPAETKGLADAITKIHDYLLSPAGLSDPYRRFWQLREQILSGVYNADVVLGFNPPNELARGGWTILDRLLKGIGTASANKALVDAGNYNSMSDKIGTWMHRRGPKIVELITLAAKSHPEIWGSGKSHPEAIMDWYDQVANQYFGKANAMGIVMKAGEETAPGTRITEADKAALEGISAAIDEAYKIDPSLNRQSVMGPQTLEDRFGPRPQDVLFRKPLQTVAYMLPRQFRRRAVDFSRHINALMGGEKLDNLPAAKFAAIVNELDANFHDLVRSWLEDRGKFAGGQFDPKTYKLALAKLVDGSANSIKDLLEIFRADKAGLELSAKDATKAVVGEIMSQVERVYNETARPDSDPRASFLWIQQHNSFTSARGEPIASYWFYDYGLRNNAGILNFAADASDFYFQRLYGSLITLQNDMQREADTIRNKYKGSKPMERADYDRLREIEGHKNALTRNVTAIGEAHGLTGRQAAMDWHLGRRTLGTLVSAAIGNGVTGAINLLGSYIRAGLNYQTIFGFRTLNPTWAIKFGKEIVAGGLAAARGALRAPIEATKEFSRSKSAGKAFLAGLDEFTNQTWLRDMAIGQWNATSRYQEMAQFGWFPYVSPERIANIARLAETGGAIYTPKYSSNPLIAKAQKLVHSGISYVGLAFAELPTTVFPRMFDIVSNAGMMNLSEHVAQNIKLEAARTFETLGPEKMAEMFNLKNPKDIANAERILPSMILGRWATSNNTSVLQEMFKTAGIGLNEEVVKFWKKLSEVAPEDRPKVEFLSSPQMAEFAKIHAEEINRATRTNRPTVLYTNGVLRTMFPLLGWNWNATRQAVRWFGRAKYAGKGETIQYLRMMQVVSAAALLGSTAVAAMGQEEVLRRLYKWLLGEERPGRQPWESDSDWDAVKRVLLYASSIAPALSVIPNMMFNDTPAAASQGIDLFVQNKIKDLLSYVGGVINTGDITYGLPDYTKRLFPVLRPLINALPGYSGIIDLRNQTRLIQRYAPEDLRRPQSVAGSMGSTATQLTPYGRMMVNAAMRGDMAELQSIYNEAVQKAIELGRPDPDKVVKQLYAAQNPVRVALKSQPNADQWAAIEAKMGPDERAEFEAALQRFAEGGNAIGAKVGFYEGGVGVSGGGSGQAPTTQPGQAATPQPATPPGQPRTTPTSGAPASSLRAARRSGRGGGGSRGSALRSQLRRGYGGRQQRGRSSAFGYGGGGGSLRLRRLGLRKLRV